MQLADAKIHILKEKPLATNIAEAIQIREVVRQSGIKLVVNVPRRYNPLFRSFEQLRSHIGRVFCFDFRYTQNIPDLSLGWRARRKEAGGGCLVDMGYHAIDLVQWYFGRPDRVYASMSYLSREGQKYDVEDTAMLHMQYDPRDGGPAIFGSVFVSRVFPKKAEKLTILGTRGAFEIDRMWIRRLRTDGTVVELLRRGGEWPAAFIDQINCFAQWINGGNPPPTAPYEEHFTHVAIIEAAYESQRLSHPVSVKSI
jgi:predicted dehydrogenase